MGTHSFVYDIETKDLLRDIAKFAKTRFDTNGCSKNDNRAVPVGKNKNVISMMKDEISKKKIILEFVALRTRVYAIERQTESYKISAPVVQKSLQSLKASLLMTIRPAYNHKIDLNRDDDKRPVQADGIKSLTGV